MKKIRLLLALIGIFLLSCGFNFSADDIRYVTSEAYGVPFLSEVLYAGDADAVNAIVRHGDDYILIPKDVLITEKEAQERFLPFGANVTKTYVLDHNSPIIMIGDSRFSHMIESNEQNPDRQYLNTMVDWYTKGGKDLYWFYNIVEPNLTGATAGKTIIISLGVNDIVFSGKDIKTITNEYRQMLTTISKKWADANIFFTTVNPICEADGGAAMNGIINQFNTTIKKNHPKNIHIIDAWEVLDTQIYRGYADTLHFCEYTNNALCDYYINSTMIGA